MGVLVQGGGGGNRGAFQPADRPAVVRPDFRPFFRPKKGGGDGLNRTFGRLIGLPKVRRADRYAEPKSG